MAFGPNSTNPRERRAYAHTLREKALTSGKPDDKVSALEAANNASNTRKGAGLAMNVYSALRNQDTTFSGELTQPANVTDTSNGYNVSWTGPEFARRYEAIGKMLGGTGVKLTKLHTEESYKRAADLIAQDKQRTNRYDHGRVTAEDLFNYGIAEGNQTLVESDYRVPGTLFAARAVQVLASQSPARH